MKKYNIYNCSLKTFNINLGLEKKHINFRLDMNIRTRLVYVPIPIAFKSDLIFLDIQNLERIGMNLDPVRH